ncbi:cation diffusion facilitator family transporter [Paraconexibacter sp. AEG42_29]|uniref:cation diffusion facilitator family transporter n=1 Tax=Paraconexibacter sp. AEG42_29 TaxID=2997339 RepID=UPI00339D91CE
MSTALPEAGRGQQRTALVSIGAAIVLVVLKLGTGIATGSLGLISAGIESSGDVFAALLTFLAVRLGGRPADDDHPFGHRRAENLAALGEAAILLGGGIFITIAALGQLAEGSSHLDARWYVFAVIGVAICIDVSRIAVSLRTARKYSSAALQSNAMHFGADLAGSIAVLGGLVLVAAGLDAGDAIAALFVAGVIFAAAFRLIYVNARVLMDTTPQEAYERALRAVAASAPGADVQRLRVRESGGRYFADVVVGVPPAQPVLESHQTADAIEEAVHAALPFSDVVVHIEPGGHDLSLREQILGVALAARDVREVHDVNVFERSDGAIVTLHVKFDPALPLIDAHRTADEIESGLRRLPGIREARTHLEPIEPATRTARDSDGAHDCHRAVAALVLRMSGRTARDLSVLETQSGLVVLLTAVVDPDLGLAAAHDAAGSLEAAIRREVTGLAQVIVHTEPLAH